MNSKTYNKTNFHKHTFCVFNEVEFSTIQSKKVDYKSKSGSCYFFTDEGVYRYSNHWGRAANCKWRLESTIENSPNRNRVGFALWTDFHPDNDLEKLYFISVDYSNKMAFYSHKNSSPNSENALLRTANETTKTIKQIRDLLENDAWAKYFETEDIEVLRMKIIDKLIKSNQTLQHIKIEVRNNL